MKQDEFRQRLIDGTIHVIGTEGLDKASAKQIELQTGVNAVYIYRCFKNKDDMFAKAFSMLDDEFVTKTIKYGKYLSGTRYDRETACRKYFNEIWSFLLGNREKCLTYVRYYYSPYFPKYSAEEHRQRYQPLIDQIKPAFIEEADVWMILNHIFNVMLDFAVKVHNSQMSEEDDYTEHVFRVVYASIYQYLKPLPATKFFKNRKFLFSF